MTENSADPNRTQHVPQHDAPPYDAPQDYVYGAPHQESSPPYSQQGPPAPYQGYSQQPPAYAPAYNTYVAQDHPQAVLAFVLGLLSVLGLTILGPFGWYYGRKVVREIDTNPPRYTNRGLAMAGMVLGIIGTVLMAIFVVVVVGLVIFAVAAAPSTG